MGKVVYKGWWKDDDPRYQEGWSMSISIAQPVEPEKVSLAKAGNTKDGHNTPDRTKKENGRKKSSTKQT